VSASQILGGNWKGRQQQILSLQGRIKELERIKSESSTLPKQVKQLKKENADLVEKMKTNEQERVEHISELNKKCQMAKSRCQTLTNQQRLLKEQVLALEEKGRHDDELVEALSQRLKGATLREKTQKSSQKSSPVKLESKESIVEIKQLRTKIANLENDINAKDVEIACLQKTVDGQSKSTAETQSPNSDSKDASFDQDSLDGDGDLENHFQVQVNTLSDENKMLRGQLESARRQLNESINNLFNKKLPQDELTADDLRSLRAVLQSQIQGRSKDAQHYQQLLEENRKAYLDAIQILRK